MPNSVLSDLYVASTNQLVEALVESEQRMRQRVDCLWEIVFELDRDGRIAFLNRAWEVLLRRSPVESVGKELSRYFAKEDRAIFEVALARAAEGKEAQTAVLRLLDSSDCATWMEISLSSIENGFVGTLRDVTERRQAQERITHLAYRDGLTDLPNRTLLRDRIEQSIAFAHREGTTMALLFIDLDHFKNINDSLGHAVGDHLLKDIAQRCARNVRETDTVGRLGGDEFLVLLPDTDADAAAHVARKMLEECSRPMPVGAHSLTVTPSIGIAMYPKDGASFDDLLRTADMAMYRSKDEGRNTYRFYTPEMNQAVFQRMLLESNLRHAVANNEFVLHYQPKFSLADDHSLVGIEALIRWRQPEMGMISPNQFIPVAEESPLIEAIGAWALEEACRQVKVWRGRGLASLRVAVNFSARQFAATNISRLVADTLTRVGVSGNALEIEITESLLAQDMDYTFTVLQSLKTLGVRVAVDDFGTGYSSLSYLKRFPIDRLKIDQSFVHDLVIDADDRAIAAAIVHLGHSLDISVIAEGVETFEQMEILRAIGCDEVQGYYLGIPIPADEMSVALKNYVAAGRSRKSARRRVSSR